MNRPRISIRGMVLAIAVISGTLAGLKAIDWPVDKLGQFALLAFLLLAFVGAFRACNRTFWVGCAVFGWGFFGLTFVLPSLYPKSDHLAIPREWLEFAFERLNPEHMKRVEWIAPPATARYPDGVIFQRFTAYCHALACFTLSIAGGFISTAVFKGKRGDSATNPNGSEPRAS